MIIVRDLVCTSNRQQTSDISSKLFIALLSLS